MVQQSQPQLDWSLAKGGCLFEMLWKELGQEAGLYPSEWTDLGLAERLSVMKPFSRETP